MGSDYLHHQDDGITGHPKPADGESPGISGSKERWELLNKPAR